MIREKKIATKTLRHKEKHNPSFVPLCLCGRIRGHLIREKKIATKTLRHKEKHNPSFVPLCLCGRIRGHSIREKNIATKTLRHKEKHNPFLRAFVSLWQSSDILSVLMQFLDFGIVIQ